MSDREGKGVKLSRLSFSEARTALEGAPGIGGNPWELHRDDLAQLGIEIGTLRLNGPPALVGREVVSVNVPATVANFGFVAFIGARGLRIHAITNRAVSQIFLTRLASFDAVRALAGFAAAGSATRTGFEPMTGLSVITGVTTAPTPLGALNLLTSQVYVFNPETWVPPGIAALVYCGVTNTAFDGLFELSEPDRP